MTASGQDDVSRQAWWAVNLAAAAVVVLVASFGLFGMVWATDGDADSVEGLVYAAYLGAALASLVAFALAVSARLGQQRWTPLWLPLCLFPTLFAIWLLAFVQGS